MKHVKEVLDKILFPRLAVVMISVPAGIVLLCCTFWSGNEDSPIAYISYTLSAYGFLIVCARIIRIPKANFGAALHRNKYIHRYLTDIPFKIQISLYVSLGLNLLFAAMKLFYGVYYRSVWFGTLAVYYIMLAMIRFLLLRHVNGNGIGTDMVSELRQYRLCGMILLLMNAALSGVMILVIRKNEGFHYAGYLIYVAAMYAFYNMITAIRDVVKYRKYKSPVLSAAKAVKLAAALVSMLALENAMLMQFNNGENAEDFRRIMTGTIGGAVCVTVVATAVFMIVKSTGQLKKRKNTGIEK